MIKGRHGIDNEGEGKCGDNNTMPYSVYTNCINILGER